MPNRSRRSLAERLMPWFKNKGRQPVNVVPMGGDWYVVPNRADRRSLGMKPQRYFCPRKSPKAAPIPGVVIQMAHYRRRPVNRHNELIEASMRRHPAGSAIGR